MIVNSSGQHLSRTVHDHEQQGMRESRLSSWHCAATTSLPHRRSTRARPHRTGPRRLHHAHHGHRLLPHPPLTPKEPHPRHIVPVPQDGPVTAGTGDAFPGHAPGSEGTRPAVRCGRGRRELPGAGHGRRETQEQDTAGEEHVRKRRPSKRRPRKRCSGAVLRRRRRRRQVAGGT